MTIYKAKSYTFTTNVEDNYEYYDPSNSPDGVYKGDGSELMPDIRKLYYCSRDYSIQEQYRINEHGHYFMKPDDIIFRNKRWYRVKQTIDISMQRNGSYGGATTLHYHDKKTHLQRTDRKIYTKSTGVYGEENTENTGAQGYSYVDDDGVPHTVEDHYIERTIQNGKLIEEKVIYLVTQNSDGGESFIETYREKIRDIAGYPTKVVDFNYEEGEEFLIDQPIGGSITQEIYDQHYFTRTIETVAILPSYDNEAYFEPLKMFTNICVEYDWLPSYRIMSEDGKLYNTVIKEGQTIYEIVVNGSANGVFLGNVAGDKVEIETLNDVFELKIGKYDKDVKFVKFPYKTNRFKVTVLGDKTGIGMLLCGEGVVIGRTKANYTIHPYDTSIYKENKARYIEYIEGIFIYDYESEILEYLENKPIVLDIIKDVKQNLIGVDFDENSNERYTKTIGRMIVKDIIEKKKIKSDKNSYGLRVPFVVRSTT